MNIFPRWPWRTLVAYVVVPLAVVLPVFLTTFPLPPLISPFAVVAAPTPAPDPPTECEAWKVAGGQIIYFCENDDNGDRCYVNAMMLFCLPQ